MKIVIRRQKRRNLAFTVREGEALVLIPLSLTHDHPAVRAFIVESLERLIPTSLPTVQHSRTDIDLLIERWMRRLNVTVQRVQIRRMIRKWGSMSTEGNLTLSEDVFRLPFELAEYVVVHELLHAKFPNHNKAWQVSMGMYVPRWRKLEQELQAYAAQKLGDSSS